MFQSRNLLSVPISTSEKPKKKNTVKRMFYPDALPLSSKFDYLFALYFPNNCRLWSKISSLNIQSKIIWIDNSYSKKLKEKTSDQNLRILWRRISGEKFTWKAFCRLFLIYPQILSIATAVISKAILITRE